jgi:hypothetical protein
MHPLRVEPGAKEKRAVEKAGEAVGILPVHADVFVQTEEVSPREVDCSGFHTGQEFLEQTQGRAPSR